MASTPAGYSETPFASGTVLTSANLKNYLLGQVICYFASTGARDSAITSPQTGQWCFVASTGLMFYNGSWKTVAYTDNPTWTVSTPGVPSGATNFVMPKRIRVPSGLTATLTRADYCIRGGTSVTFDVRSAASVAGITAGSTVTGFTSLSAATTAATTAPTAVTLSDGTYYGPVPSAVTGGPDNWTCDLTIVYTFTG